MNRTIKRICVLGGGSAGYLSAVTMRRLLPDREVIVVHSPDKPVIGVGESTTAYFPVFLHRQLQLDRKRFYAEVDPSWKLGIRFIWGPPDVEHFNYAFGFELSERFDPLRKRTAYYCLKNGGYPGPITALMEHDLSPCMFAYGGHCHLLDQPFGYHIDNKKFLAYLETIAREFGVTFVAGNVADVTRDDADDVSSLILEDGSELAADLFVDCSGFGSLLLGKTLGERFVDYGDTLLCDRAVVGGFHRDGPILPYTTAETMDHGWCWRIDLRDSVTLGYVYSSQFCTPDEATRELRRKKPELGDDLRAIQFPSGRYENYWNRNVVAIGNASGFVEPLESTALHVIAEQLIGTCAALLDSDYRIEPPAREIQNQRFRRNWDAIRDFLAVHYRFNSRLDTPFWRFCRENTSLGGAQALVELYEQVGPHQALKALLSQDTLVQFEGYLALLMGQRVATHCANQLDDQDLTDWAVYQEQIRDQIAQALPMREALRRVNAAEWRWGS